MPAAGGAMEWGDVPHYSGDLGSSLFLGWQGQLKSSGGHLKKTLKHNDKKSGR
jgi:hypothetical protein